MTGAARGNDAELRNNGKRSERSPGKNGESKTGTRDSTQLCSRGEKTSEPIKTKRARFQIMGYNSPYSVTVQGKIREKRGAGGKEKKSGEEITLFPL